MICRQCHPQEGAIFLATCVYLLALQLGKIMVTHPQTPIHRRSLMKGAAWAAPAVAASAAVPAYAASVCGSPGIDYNPRTGIYWGVLATSATDTATTDMRLNLGTTVGITNLPAGVTVDQVKVQWFVENHQGQTAKGNGMFFIGNTSSSYNKSGACTSTGCTVQWVQQARFSHDSATSYRSTTAGTGWSSTLKNTQNNVATTFSDGVTRNAWDITMTTSPGAGTYTTDARGCRNYTSGYSGDFAVNYTGIPRETAGTTTAIFSVVTITLSDGQVVSFRGGTNNIPAK